MPFSLEQVTNDTNNIFLERSIPTQGIFAADREVGVAAYGCNDAQNLTWTFGTFFDSISESLKERQDDNQGQRLSGRLTFLPYYDEPSNGRYLVHTGAGVLYTRRPGRAASFPRAPANSRRAVPDRHRRLAHWRIHDRQPRICHGLGAVLGAERSVPLQRQSDRRRTPSGSAVLMSTAATSSPARTASTSASASTAPSSAATCRIPTVFWVPGCCGPGAWEVKARWSNLNLQELNSTGEYNDLTLGFNWYWSDRTRIMFD